MEAGLPGPGVWAWRAPDGRGPVDRYRTGGTPMDLKLNGKRALVTGSSSGLGEAIAQRLAAG